MTVSLNRLAQAVDQYYNVRLARLEKDKEAAELKKQETELKQFLIDNISKSDATGVCGRMMRATLRVKPEPTAEDWEAIRKYVTRYKAWDILQKRLSTTAIKERWDDGKQIPGVGTIQVVDVSLTSL